MLLEIFGILACKSILNSAEKCAIAYDEYQDALSDFEQESSGLTTEEIKELIKEGII